MNISELNSLVVSTRRSIDQEVGELRSIVRQYQTASEELSSSKEEIELLDKVIGVLNSVGESRQKEVQDQIEGLVTRGLQTIFSENLSFHLVSSLRGSAANIDFIVVTHLEDGSAVETPVLDGRGGGLAAIVGFLLRVVVLMLDETSGSRVLILDETFAHVSAEYEPRLAEFIKDLVDGTDLQVLMVTHSTAYSDLADKVYRFTEINGKTKVDVE